jgi:RNA polymerase sigma-70 factor (ECF subfamily)
MGAEAEGAEPDPLPALLGLELEQAAAPARAKAVTAAPKMREYLFMHWTRMWSRAGSAEPAAGPSSAEPDSAERSDPTHSDTERSDTKRGNGKRSDGKRSDAKHSDAERTATEQKGQTKRDTGMAASTEVLDEAALRLLYAEHSGPVLAYLLKLTRDRARAEDLLQETMLRAWRRPEAFQPGRGSVRAWLCTVAHNLVVDDARSRAARPTETELTEYTERAEDGIDPYEAALRAWEFADALAALSAEHRAVVIEVYYRRATVNEAARALGIPPGTVKSRTFYALRALRLACQERGITP